LDRLNSRRLGALIACSAVLVTSAAARAAGSDAANTLDAAAIGVGVGRSFTTWDTRGVLVLPLTVSFDEDRYELAAFRLTGTQRDVPWPGVTRVLAEPYWTATGSRRFTLWRGARWRAFVGLGGAYKTSVDYLSASHWNFNESLGARFALPAGGLAFEFAVRHWSNAGLRRPNYGQNLATLGFLWHPWKQPSDAE
jgi:hypothetical protein